MKAIALIRVSTLHQDLNQQTEAVIAEIVKDGYKKENIILIEEKESAVKLDEEARLGINRMKSSIEDDAEINAVYVFELSRLSRRPDVLYSVRDYLINRKIQLIVLKPYMRLLEDDGQVSQTASIMFAIFGALAEQEGYVRKERLARGKLTKKVQGIWAGGNLPFGYTVNPKTHAIEVDPVQADIVRRMFTMYVLEGKSTGEIAKYFNQTGELQSCTGKATVETARCAIGHMLKNPVYIGEKSWNRRGNKPVENVYPRIITDELLEAAKQRLARVKGNTPVERRRKYVYFCKGLIKDTQGHKLSGFAVANAYKYSEETFDGNRYNITVPLNLVDSLVWHFVKEYRSNNTPIKITDLRKQSKSEINEYIKKIGTAYKKVDELDKKIVKINDRIVSGRLKESVGDTMIDQITEQIDRLKTDIVEWTLRMQHLAELIDRIDRGDAVNPETAGTDEEMAEIVKDCVLSVEVEQSFSWGIYDMTITFEDYSFKMIRFKSMSRKAWDSLTGENIEFEYMERYVRPDTQKDRDIKQQKEEEEQRKHRVGRPRKIKEDTPKRPVGRPRKQPIEDKPKRPVGRPRKIEATSE
jgi:DNA invertase Pin-like site-specific DNA recombinase